MKLKIFFIIFFFIFLSLPAQQTIPLDEDHYLDSLNSSVKTQNDHNLKANSYFLLSNYYKNSDSVLSKNYLLEGKTLGDKSKISNGKYYFYEGQYYADRSKIKAAISFQNSINYLSKLNTKEADFLQSYAWYYFGVANKNKKGYPFLIDVLLKKSIPLAEKHQNQKQLGHLYTLLGFILTYNAEFQKAEIYNKKAVSILEKNAPRSTELFSSYLSSATTLCYLAKGDEAKTFVDKAEKLISPYPNSSSNSAFYYNKTLYFITKQDHPNALSAIEKGLVYTRKFNQKQQMQMFYFHKFDILKKLKKYTEAKALLENILKEKTLSSDAGNKKTIYNELTNINELMGNPAEALVWSRKYSKLNDSLYDSKLKFEINDLETKFRTSEKEKQIVKLSSEKAQKEFEISKKNQYLLLLGLTSVLFLSLGIFAFFYFKNKRKLAEQREINLQQKLKETEQREELKVTKAILDGEERERERIAKDLHDGLGGMLAGIKINFSTWSSNHLESSENQGFNKILSQLDSSVSELRRVARNLMPETLLNFGLEIALKDLCDFYMKNNLHIDFQAININKNLPLGVQINIYRIAQELLTNSVKHANANNILLQCSQSENIFFITLEDNGNGFQENNPEKPKSMGLKNLKNRVDYLQGKMEINSEPDAGTFINIELKTNAVS